MRYVLSTYTYALGADGVGFERIDTDDVSICSQTTADLVPHAIGRLVKA